METKMIRVIYRWQVAPENLAQFKQEWTTATNKIHETVTGALGSFMLQDAEQFHPIKVQTQRTLIDKSALRQSETQKTNLTPVKNNWRASG